MGEIATAIFAKYDKGYHYLRGDTSTWGLREIYVQMGGVDSIEVVNEISLRLLAARKNPRLTKVDSGIYRSFIDHIPGAEVGYKLGDTLGTELLTGFTVTEDADGAITVAPELLDPQQRVTDYLDRVLRRMSAGGATGVSHPVTTTPPAGTSTSSTPPSFSHSGRLTPTESPVWICPAQYWVTWLEASLTKPGSTTTTAVVTLNGGTVGSVSLVTGATKAIAVVHRGWQVRDKMTLKLTAAGNGAEGLQVATRGTPVM